MNKRPMISLSRTAKHFFSPHGPLSRQPGFEHRPQQGTMAAAIADALHHQRHLIVEAPTGVGKTLAYLVPAVLYAVSENRKAIVSTYTKNLQAQILNNDVPIVSALVGRKFSAVVLKGRRNYLCSTRLHHALASAGSLFDPEGIHQLKDIHAWSLSTQDGDAETLGFIPRSDIWDMVCSEKDICGPTTCGAHCFFQRMKERIKSVNLVIMNHALFFTTLAMQGSDDHYIFDDDFVIFDEAHMLEGVAGISTGRSLSRSQVLARIHKLYNPRTQKGLLAHEKTSLKLLCKDAEKAAVDFFESIRHALAAPAPPSRRSGGFSQSTREVPMQAPFLVPNTLDAPLQVLQTQLSHAAEDTDHQQYGRELVASQRSIEEARVLIKEFLEQTSPAWAYWIELTNVRGDNVTLCAAPISIAETTGPRLFRSGTSVIMTSATLAVSGSLSYFQQRIGAQDAQGIILDSPFDYLRQMKLRIAPDIPEPDTDAYLAELPAWIMRSIEETGGRSLVLFTSNALMQTVASTLREECEMAGIPLLLQGTGAQRSQLLDEFKRDIRSVLFGLDSFWMGIDVPGEALEHVVITRLPFSVPSHPLIEARLKAIAQGGGNPFMEYTLPEAVLKFRQGVGRLLRSSSDKGLVTVLDSRILTKQYGQMFLSSLPRCPIELMRSSGERQEMPLEQWL